MLGARFLDNSAAAVVAAAAAATPPVPATLSNPPEEALEDDLAPSVRFRRCWTAMRYRLLINAWVR